MYFLIRQVLKSGADSFESADSEVVVDCLSLGSGHDQHLHISGAAVAEQHAVIKKIQGTIKIECLGNKKIKLNGQDVENAILSVDDKVEIGNIKLLVFAAPAGFDLALQVEKLEKSAGSAMSFESSNKGFPSIRLLSYGIFLLVIILGLIVPLLKGGAAKSDEWLSQKIWQSGPFHNAHQIPALAENCQTCHQEPFQRVPDTACTSCHANTVQHANIDWDTHKEFKVERCASCHREHNEGHSLVRSDAAYCVDCHGQLNQQMQGQTALPEVLGFSQQEHPLFALQQMSFNRDQQRWISAPTKVALTDALDQSNLRFDHQLHLDQNKVWDSLSGDGLDCQSCHQLSSDNEHFIPITMDSSCRSCHALSIEANGSERILPHGKPALVAETIEEYFISKLSKPQVQATRRLLPGSRAQSKSCSGTALECGTRMAAEMIDAQFSQSGCITCHIVEDTGASDIKEKWQVLPVKLTQDWYPLAVFNHKAHLPLQQLSNGNSKSQCLYCHKVETSTSSEDVLIPDQQNCLQCHDSQQAHSVKMECNDCHRYHSQTLDQLVDGEH